MPPLLQPLVTSTELKFCGGLDVCPPDKMLHGGKGAGLLEMSRDKLPVPPALILTTDAWRAYKAGDVCPTHGVLPTIVIDQLNKFLNAYGDGMFSVRSGAPESMPGMMDTVLNVGADTKLDMRYPGAFRRFVIGWLTTAKGVAPDKVEAVLHECEKEAGDNPALFRCVLRAVLDASGWCKLPDNRLETVLECVRAVFDSWDTPRAKAYRKDHGISHDMGTACIIQRMVMGIPSSEYNSGLFGSGVMFTRDPATGEDRMVGEIAFNAQGEDVVSGAVTPMSLDHLPQVGSDEMVALHSSLEALANHLQATYNDVQDVEFTVEDGDLYVLQTRTAKMSARARVVTACEFMYADDRPLKYLRDRVDPNTVQACRVATVLPTGEAHATGLPASPGAISGRVVTRSTPLSKVTKGCILVAQDTAPQDYPRMSRAGGILTQVGGFTCHSAVVARGINVPAVVGCGALHVKPSMVPSGYTIAIGEVGVQEGDIITIDGATGTVWVGRQPVQTSGIPRDLYYSLHWCLARESPGLAKGAWLVHTTLNGKTAVVLDPSDLSTVEAALKRAEQVTAKGHKVGFVFEQIGAGEDLLELGQGDVYERMFAFYGSDLVQYPILTSLPSKVVTMLAAYGKAKLVSPPDPPVMDLLDLLHKDAPE